MKRKGAYHRFLRGQYLCTVPPAAKRQFAPLLYENRKLYAYKFERNGDNLSIKGRIHSVETFGAVDGPGVRYVLFVQGCPLRCLYCHNPDSWKFASGKEITSEEAVQNILEYKGYIKNGGVTISGGEPLAQPEFVMDIIRRCHEEGLQVAIDTSGSVSLEVAKPVIDMADMLLLDIKSDDKEVCYELTGRQNDNAYRILAYCEETGKRVWIRHVLLPGYTLKKERLEGLADFIKNYKCVEKTELLPFHKMGEYKWEVLEEKYMLYDTPAPTYEETEEAKNIFRKRGLAVN